MNARKRIGTVGVALFAGLSASAPAQAASLTCPAEPTQQTFQRWLDPAHYVPMPGGTFEAEGGWTLSDGARRVPGNEPWYVAGADDSTALSLPAGASAISPPVCISVDRPTIRFFARNQGSLLGQVRVTVLVPTVLGEVRLPIGTVLDPTDDWSPTPPTLAVVNLLSLLGGPGDVRFELTASGYRSDWLVDDVYVDPYSKG